MLMPTASRFCAELAKRNQIPSGDPIITSLHFQRRLTVDSNRKSASCFLAPFKAVGNAFRWTLNKIYIAKFPAGDREKIVAFLKKKDAIVLDVIKDNLTTFQNAWPREKFDGSSLSIRDFISDRYKPCFREKYTYARARDSKAPIGILLRIAHRLATAEVLNTSELHEGPLKEINRRVQEEFELNDECQEATVRFIQRHYK